MSENTPKVLCPYCGAEMKPHITAVDEERDPWYNYHCSNLDCHALSPKACSRKEAHMKAFRRPLQKPLTTEDLQSLQKNHDSIVWLEAHNPDDVLWDDGWGAPRFYSERRFFFSRMGADIFDVAFRIDYGKTWRCWALKPTEEDREAARWCNDEVL